MLPKTKRLSLRHLTFSKIPATPGVYIFWQQDLPIYIGKAVNLKSRLKSYFAVKLFPKTARMIKEADSLSFISVASELESLLLEAKLIRGYKPKYNFAAKDDKHPLYIRVTKEDYPRVITARKIDDRERNLAFFGPFPSSSSVRMVLKLLRRVFPFSDHKLGKRPCLYSQISLCHPCPNFVDKLKDERKKKILRKQYMTNIRKLISILSGNIKKVRNALSQEMLSLANAERFEEAQGVRNKLERLNYITQPVIPSAFYLENPNLIEDIRRRELKSLKEILSEFISLRRLTRIECFDVAHLVGSAAAASMVTFVGGEADKNFYRHFRIRQKRGQDDISSLREVVKRRINHLKNWGVPDLIIVDGGKTQASVFYQELSPYGIATLAIAKGEEKLVIPIKNGNKIEFREKALARGPALNLVQRIRDEAHRFARRYHHLLVKKTLLPFNSKN